MVQSTLFQEDSPASHIAKQEKDLEKKMNATCGRKCLEQFEKFNRATLWAKTFAALLIGTGDWYSTRCRLTWSLRATKCYRFYFQLAPLTLPTEEIEFGLLPTPKAFHASMEHEMTNTEHKRYRKNDLMNLSLLPTPDTQNHRNGTSLRKDNNMMEGGKHGVSLHHLAAHGMLPTPATRDYKGARTSEALQEAERTGTNSLPDFFAQTGKTSQLNPRFVLEMMGFPPDWTLQPFLSQSGEMRA
jgi:hypothetical protein